eukprot:1193661-Rhodomonas_salina.1
MKPFQNGEVSKAREFLQKKARPPTLLGTSYAISATNVPHVPLCSYTISATDIRYATPSPVLTYWVLLRNLRY